MDLNLSSVIYRQYSRLLFFFSFSPTMPLSNSIGTDKELKKLNEVTQEIRGRVGYETVDSQRGT